MTSNNDDQLMIIPVWNHDHILIDQQLLTAVRLFYTYPVIIFKRGHHQFRAFPSPSPIKSLCRKNSCGYSVKVIWICCQSLCSRCVSTGIFFHFNSDLHVFWFWFDTWWPFWTHIYHICRCSNTPQVHLIVYLSLNRYTPDTSVWSSAG